MSKPLVVVKIGGNVIDDDETLTAFLKRFAQIPGKKMLVHGGGRVASEMAAQLGIPVEMVEGRRVTSAETLKVVTMVFAGLVNKKIVAGLQAEKCNAFGFCGADGNAMLAEKRMIKDLDYGFVGDVAAVDISSIESMLENGLVPIFAPITHDGNGTLLNTNADTVATELAIALSLDYQVQLQYCFEKTGVMLDADNENSLIEEIAPDEYQILKEDGVITDGMIPKMDNAFQALRNGVRRVLIAHADNVLLNAVGRKVGTEITREKASN